MIKFLLCLLLTLPALAETKPVNQPADDSIDWEKRLIETNVEISQWLDDTADGIDLFLVGRRLTKEQSTANIRVDNTTFIDEGKNFANVSSIIIRPRFRNLEQYLQLQLSSFDETDNNREVQNKYIRTNRRTTNYGASVGFFKKLGSVKTYFQPRIQLSNPLKISHTLGFQSVVAYKKFQFNPKLELYANPTNGVGVFQAYNLNFILSPKYTLTLINEGDYQEKAHLFGVGNGFAIGQFLDSKSALTYSFIMNSNNKTRYHLDGYTAAVTLNYLIYKDILNYQITPHLDFLKARRYKGQIGFIFNISLNF